MSSATIPYSISIFSRLGAGDTPSSAVRMELTGNSEHIRQSIQTWKDAICSYGKPPENAAAEACGFRLSDGSDEDVLVFCTEAEILSSLLAFFCDICADDFQTAVKELRYQGSVFEDIAIRSLPMDSSPALYVGGKPLAVEMRAKKDGRDTTVYFFGPQINIEYNRDDCDDGAFYHVPEEWEEDYGAPADEECENESDDTGDAPEGGFWDGYDVYLSYNLSNGIIEESRHLTYVWNYSHSKEQTYQAPTWAFDNRGQPRRVQNAVVITKAMHIFLEAEGQDLTFSVLLDGRLYRKLSHDAEKIVFYDTPLDRAARTSDGFRQGENPKDLIFRKINGVYRYDRNSPDSTGLSGFTIDPPRLPDSLDQASGRRLYEDYLKAVCAAISNAETYQSAIGVFRHDEAGNGRFLLETEGFLLTGISQWELVRHEHDTLPLEYRDFLEDYPGEDMFSFFRLESAAFTEESTGNTITLFPEDGYSFEAPEKDERFDDIYVSDWNGDPAIRRVTVDAVLRVLVTSPAGETLYDGSFSELRKGNVFRAVTLPETIRFSKEIKNFAEDRWIYLAIRQAILGYSVSKILAVFTRQTAVNPEEIERLLYADGEMPDKAVTALAVKMKRQFARTGEIPNIALVGQAGTGKSTMIRHLGELFAKRVRFLSPSELKGQYLGHTEFRVVEQLAGTLMAGEIFFIDEAYELMSDNFGREAVALLLPIMSGDRTSVTAHNSDKQTSTSISIDFKKREITRREETNAAATTKTVTYEEPGYPPIWIAGYEDEIRLMLGQNKGLYRRIQRVTLRTPTPEQLHETLLRKLKELEGAVAPLCYETLARQFALNREMLLKFFYWGTQPQNSRYFANYAGVISFLDNCVDGIDFAQPEDRITGQMSEIIAGIKRDVKRQLDTVRRNGAQNAASGYDDSEHIQMVTDIKTRFGHLDGCESQIEYMQGIIDMFKEKSLYDRRGLTIPKGALLLGPPGVGKTFIARAMAGELQAQFEEQVQKQLDSPEAEAQPGNHRVGFMSLSAPEIITRPVSFIGSIFDKAEEYDVCVIFIDEVDAIAKNRFQNPSYSHFIELIKQMDGVEQRSNVFILAATNAPEYLDPAFVRSGRIDKKLEFTLPGKETRRKMAKRCIEKRCGAMENFTDSDEDREDIARLAGAVAELTPGNTAGDIENIINDAFILYYKEYAERRAARVREPPLGKDVPAFSGREWGHLYRSIYEMVERANIGDPRPVGKEEFCADENDGKRSATSIHEVGHALVRILSGRDPFEKITSLPRGGALGYVMPKQDATWTKRDYENRIRFAMGGRAAEEIVYGPDNISAGASLDIQQATYFARMMVERIGFTEEIGFMAITQSTARYLKERSYSCSESFRLHSDQVVNDLLKRLYQETREMLSDKKSLIIDLAREVFQRETLTGEEFKELYDHLKGR